MRTRLWRKRIRQHSDDIFDPWSEDWAEAASGSEDCSYLGGPPDGRDDPKTSQQGGDTT